MKTSNLGICFKKEKKKAAYEKNWLSLFKDTLFLLHLHMFISIPASPLLGEKNKKYCHKMLNVEDFFIH